jgi:hypothetical protein
MTKRIDIMADLQNTDSKLKSLLDSIICSSGTAQDRRNQYQFVGWCLAWAVLFTAGNQLLKSGYELAAPLKWLVAIVPILVGFAAILSYRKFLRMADELMQKIQLEGLAAGFGIGVVFALSYQILERAGAPRLQVDDLALVLIGGWMAGLTLATWRYR